MNLLKFTETNNMAYLQLHDDTVWTVPTNCTWGFLLDLRIAVLEKYEQYSLNLRMGQKINFTWRGIEFGDLAELYKNLHLIQFVNVELCTKLNGLHYIGANGIVPAYDTKCPAERIWVSNDSINKIVLPDGIEELIQTMAKEAIDHC